MKELEISAVAALEELETLYKVYIKDRHRALHASRVVALSKKQEDGLIDLNDDPIKNYNKFRAHATWPRTVCLT